MTNLNNFFVIIDIFRFVLYNECEVIYMSEMKPRYQINNFYPSNPLKFGDVYLLQIGRRYCEVGDVITAHPHFKWFEFTSVTGGRGTISTNGTDTEVRPGDIYVSFPCDVHEIRADLGERMEYDFFSFYCEDEALRVDLNRLTREYRAESERVFSDGKIAELIKNAISEFSDSEKPYSKAVLADIFHLIVIYLIRNFENSEMKSQNVSDSEILCFNLMQYIDTHIYSIKNLADIAKKFNYNYGYLSGLFKKTTGKTLSEYCNHRKMETAKVLVMEKKKKIGEIAEMLGYNLYSFSKAFKEKFGVSPKNMQKSI